jgi:hypothetical protein
MNKEQIEKEISEVLLRHQEIRLAYLYGSFVSNEHFNDIDIGIILDERFQPDLLYPEGLAREIKINLQNKFRFLKNIDLRVLNSVKNVRFLNSMLKSAHLLVSRDNFERAGFEARVIDEYLDMKRFYEKYDDARRARYGAKP